MRLWRNTLVLTAMGLLAACFGAGGAALLYQFSSNPFVGDGLPLILRSLTDDAGPLGVTHDGWLVITIAYSSVIPAGVFIGALITLIGGIVRVRPNVPLWASLAAGARVAQLSALSQLLPAPVVWIAALSAVTVTIFLATRLSSPICRLLDKTDGLRQKNRDRSRTALQARGIQLILGLASVVMGFSTAKLACGLLGSWYVGATSPLAFPNWAGEFSDYRLIAHFVRSSPDTLLIGAIIGMPIAAVCSGFFANLFLGTKLPGYAPYLAATSATAWWTFNFVWLRFFIQPQLFAGLGLILILLSAAMWWGPARLLGPDERPIRLPGSR